MKTTSTRPVLVFFLALLGLTSCVSDSVWLPKSTGVRLSSTVRLTSPSPPGFSLSHFPDAKLTPSSCASCPDASENLHRLGALERGALNLSESRVYSQATVRTSNKRTESTSREDHQDDTLPIFMTSLTSGVVWSSESSCPRLGYYCPMDASFTVTVPENHATMISFSTFVMQWAHYTFRYGFAELSAIRADGSTSRIWRAKSQVSVQFKCLDLSALRADDSMSRIWRATSQVTILPEVFHTSVRLRVFVPSYSKLTKGFSMRFSIHSDRETPPTVRRGVFNCSVPFFPAFKQHLACNLKAECEGGEDENSDCPFTDRAACPGGVVVEGKCFTHVFRNRTVTWEVARRDCQKRGGDLATLTSSLQWQAFFRLASSKNLIRQMYIGLKSYRTALPRIYNYLYVWVDGIVNYRIATRVDDYTRFFNTICFMHKGSPRYEYLYYIACDEYLYQDYVCQITVHNITGNTSILLPPLFPGSNDGVNTSAMFVNNGNGSSSPLDEDNLMYVRCEDGHVTHNFLSCDTRSQCGEKSYPSQCSIESNGSDTNSVEMFPCDDQTMTIHYTLVCDFRQDCHDGSDESLCVHRQDCQAFQCHSGQCIYPGMKCNGVTDCWDGSDEECIRYLQRETSTYLLEPPAEVSFDTGQQSVTIRGQSDVVCPMTHYLCPDGFCFPLYTRCNGVADCAGREDEAGCQEVQCPGLYRCLSSAVCLHADHLCDGWPQCPQRDDEWLCQHDCPKECQCQGHAFVCSSRFPAASFPHLRYLDAADSGMETRDVTGLSYLVWLSLRQCGLTGVTEMSLPNVRTLDLSHNDLDFLAMDVFLPLINLRVLDLSHNPLSVLVSHGSVLRQLSLGHVDLSHVLLGSFNSSVLSGFPTVTTLNLSESDVTAITADGFQYTPSLRVLDLRGSDVREYPRDVFLNHTHLRAIYADNYKLCCKDLLPEGFDQSNCHAPVDEISSCDDLLRSNSYRAFLWIFSVLSILGNLGSLVSRLFLVRRKSGTSFNMFVTNLSVADLLMGVYLALVGSADHVYRGRYFWFEETWKPSVACKIAGFLSLLSNEVSAFTICLITLDRFLVLSSPFSDVRFRKMSTAVACVLAWTIGLCLAAVPLLPGTSEWEFYSHTGICIPLPITRSNFKGRNYAFGIMIIFNLVLFVLIAVGQAMIYHSIRTSSSVAQSSTRKTKDLTIARRLVSVVVSDFLCWFPIGILGVLATTGTPIPGEVNVGMAIFVLPLNAALNPFLYTFNALMEKWKAREEDRLLKQLEARSQNLVDN